MYMANRHTHKLTIFGESPVLEHCMAKGIWGQPPDSDRRVDKEMLKKSKTLIQHLPR